MNNELRVLIIEDSEDDAFLIRRELQRGGFKVEMQRVDNIQDMLSALNQSSSNQMAWDLVISDYNLPGFDGLHVLREFQLHAKDIPFILISGAVGEEIAVNAMKAGAHDYIKKDNLSRLVPAIQRELREASIRHERRQIREMLFKSEDRYQKLVDNMPVGIYRVTLEASGKILMANPAFLNIFGFDPTTDLAQITMADLFENPGDQVLLRNKLLSQGRINSEEWRFRRRDGSIIWGMITGQAQKNNPGEAIYADCTIEDVTARKQALKLQDALYQIAQAISTTQTLEELTGQIHTIVNGLMEADNFYLALFDEKKSMISFPYFADEIDSNNESIPFGSGLTSLVIQTGEPLLITPDSYSQIVARHPSFQIGPKPVDWLGVPLKNRASQTIGALVVQSYNERFRYSENDQSILAFVSSQVAIAVERRQSEEALRRSEIRQRALLDAIPDLIIVVDDKGYIQDFKAPLGNGSDLFDLSIGDNITRIFPESVSKAILDSLGNIFLKHSQEIINFHLTIETPERTTRYFESRMTPSAEKQALLLVRDISEQKQAEKRLEDQRSFLRQVIDINPNLIFAKDRNGRFTLANQAVAEIYGTTVENLIGKTDGDFNANPEEVRAFQHDDLDVIESLTQKVIEEETLTDTEGKLRRLHTVKLPLYIPELNDVQVLGVSSDITYTFQDALTSLPNRRVFIDRLGRVLERNKRHSKTYNAVLLLDLDRFAMINESFGHQTGDDLLIKVGHRLASCLRTMDTISRLGGDEFALLVEDLESLNSITQIAERILTELGLPFDLNEQRVVISASIGIVICSVDYESPENIMRDADVALHRAKSAGKGRYELFRETMRENVRYFLQLETDLRQAIQHNELVINYEPIVNIDSGQTISLEALLRWQHPKRGTISPGEFISLAEETGLIIPIGEWVLTEACRQMQAWHNQFPITRNISVSVNLSSKQFSQTNLPARITNILSATGYAPSRLTLEITESIIIENKEQTIQELNQLRGMGIHIHMDDFGTGYSSLVYLHLLPLNAIKIDRSFISGTGNPTNGQEIVRTIIRLANDLHMETVAEGVETYEQLSFLKAMGCSHIQGYLLTKPMDPSMAECLLSEKQGKFDLSTFR